MPKLTVVLPVYNEQAVLKSAVSKIHTYLSDTPFKNFEILIADNGSTDRTLETAKLVSRSYGSVRILHLKEKGRGRSLKEAWSVCDSDIVSYMDIDISTDLSAFPELIKAVDGGFDIAIGSRWVPGASVNRSVVRGVLSGGYNLLLRIVLGVDFRDAQCGFKAMKKSVFTELASESEEQ